MVSSNASTVEEYIDSLAPDRREAVEKVRGVILENLPEGYQESMQFGMIGYCVPLSRYPKTYNGQALAYLGLASQKNYLSLYLTCVYAEGKAGSWFEEEYKKTGKKLNMGKSCLRFKKADDLPLELIARVVARTSPDEFIAIYERAREKPGQC